MTTPKPAPDPAASRCGPPLPRLKRRGDFLRVAGTRLKWVAPGFILQAGPTPAAARNAASPAEASVCPPRLGFTVSRKVGNAVTRNRARRRLRAAADAVFPDHARPGWDYVLIGRQATGTLPFSRLLDDMRTALVRLPTRPAGSGGGGSGGGSTRSGRGGRGAPRRQRGGQQPSAAPPSS